MKTNNSIKRSAFSLLEVSLIILIIGVIITGVLQGKHLISESRLKTARTLTNSSYVASIDSLALWLDTTSEDSFISGQGGDGEDGDAITQWLDINPQTLSKHVFTGTGTYKESGVNGLPSILFNGSSDFFTTSTFANLKDELTIFAVFNPTDLTGQNGLFSKGEFGTDASNFHLYLEGATDVRFCLDMNCTGNGVNLGVGQSHIFSIRGRVGEQALLYGNSYSPTATISSLAALDQVATNLTIGSNTATTPIFYQGHMLEIIVFDEKLSAKDHRSVTKYLSNKWGVSVSN